jgi:hypothetical protein
MSDNAVSSPLLHSLAGWAKALRRRLRSLARAGEAGFTADRLPRAEDIEFDKYAPRPLPASISQDHSREAPSCSPSSIR